MEYLIILGIIAWVAYSFWEKQQEQAAEAEYQRRREQEKLNRPAAVPAGGQPAPDRRYQDIQEEIRRKIAERQAQQRGQAPLPPPVALPQPRSVMLPPLPVPAGRALPRPPPIVVISAPPPSPVIFAPVPEEFPHDMTDAEEEFQAERNFEAMRARAVAADQADARGAPILGGENESATPGGARLALLRGALARKGSAREAFLFREVFDSPISERPGGCGGLDSWR